MCNFFMSIHSIFGIKFHITFLTFGYVVSPLFLANFSLKLNKLESFDLLFPLDMIKREIVPLFNYKVTLLTNKNQSKMKIQWLR